MQDMMTYNEACVLAFAVRYAFGRKTFAPKITIGVINDRLCRMDGKAKALLARTIREEREDCERSNRIAEESGRPPFYYFTEHDIRKWDGVLARLEEDK